MAWKTKKDPLHCLLYPSCKIAHLWGLNKLSMQREVLKGKKVLP